MSFGFRTAAETILGQPDERMNVGKILIQRQGPLKLADGLICSVGEHLDESQAGVAQGMVRREGKSFDRGRFGCRKPRGSIVGHKAGANCAIDGCHAEHCLDVAGIEFQGTLEKAPCLRQVFGSCPSVETSPALKDQIHRVRTG